jgi:alkanesulfonate monooxygenase
MIARPHDLSDRSHRVKILWYLCAPDGPFPWRPEGTRRVDHGYFRQLALAYDQLGYTGALLATGAHDVWVLASALAAETRRMRFLVAIHPGLIAPTLLAKMTATLQDFSGGRLMLNVVSGDAKTLAAYGLRLPHDERYAMADEYLSVFNRLMAGESVTFAGRYVSLEGAKLALPAGSSIAPPPLWFGGSSDAAIDVAARHAHTYLSWGETPAQIGAKIAKLRARAATYGRDLDYGIRLYVVVRDTDAEAWDAARQLYDRMDAASIAGNQAYVAGTDSVGQQRMTALHGGRKPENLRDLEVAPNLWAGLGLVRPGPGTAIVGAPDTVLRMIDAYRSAGVDTFILSGLPLLEEAYRFGETVLPRLPVDRAAPQAKSFTWNTLFDLDRGAGTDAPARVAGGERP